MNTSSLSNGDVGSRRVLVVDNEPSVLRTAKKMLGKFCQVDTASSADEAIEMAASVSYHAVITDYDMPGQSGIWLLEILKSKHPKVRRILHSGSDPADVAKHIRTGTVQRFLPKPADVDEFLETLMVPI